MSWQWVTAWTIAIAIVGSASTGLAKRDSYDVMLHSSSLREQREALTTVLARPGDYVVRVRQSLRNYPRLVRSDRTAANRAVYLAALIRDPSFAPILSDILGDSAVVSECIYACPVVFALSIEACFGGWTPPPNLDETVTTVYDLEELVRRVPLMSLEPRPIEDVTQGPGLELHRKEIEGKTEEQLIQLAGPTTLSVDTRLFAAFKLETAVSTSKNRIGLYLLVMNDIRNDASSEYRGSIYEAIYRAELAKARGR